MTDIKLQKFFEPERWERLMQKAVLKGIDRTLLVKLTQPESRVQLLRAIESGMYAIAPPHIAKIPKDDGGVREVYVNEPIDRIFLSLYNDVMFEMFGSRIHRNCKSYQKGIGCGRIVREVSHEITAHPEYTSSFKADLSKYFDNVNLKTIEHTLRRLDTGSPLDRIIWEYYHNNIIFDAEGNLTERYGGLKQGCAFASFLANIVLYDVDEALSNLDVLYYRYSDDILVIGKEADTAMKLLLKMLEPKGLTLNPKKIEYIRPDRYFTFLGFNIKGENITFSKKSLKNFQREIRERTVKSRNSTVKQATSRVNDYLHRGYIIDENRFGFGSYFLPVVNVKEDLIVMDNFVKDCLRAVDTKRTHLGGLGIDLTKKNIVQRGTGSNVTTNRERWKAKYGTEQIEGYYSLSCMQNAIRCGKPVYESLVNESL